MYFFFSLKSLIEKYTGVLHKDLKRYFVMYLLVITNDNKEINSRYINKKCTFYYLYCL